VEEFYNTRLGPEEFVKFKRWAEKDPDIRLNLHDYDMQGWWLENYKNNTLDDHQGHFTDKYKKPIHATFSKESKYSNNITEGGDWIPSGDNFWSFKPSEYQLSQKGYLSRLRNYFNSEYGRGINEVILPTETWVIADKQNN
jgi:hypothetical protein